MQTIKGGFALSDADEKLVHQQRSLTAQINNNFIQVGAVFLETSSKGPDSQDWFRRKFRDTNLQEWVDNPTMRTLNLGFNLQMGWCDIDIDAKDPRYNRSIFAAIKFLKIDHRFAFGRQSKGVPSHVMVQLTPDDQANYDELKPFTPNGFKLGGEYHKCELRSVAPLPDNAPAETKAKALQTVMPGSIYTNKDDASKYDLSVWYGNDGTVATHSSNIASTTAHRVEFSQLITAIAFGTFLYVVQPHWLEGGRQLLAGKLTGLLARVVRESQGINDNENVARGTFCPIGTPETAESLIEFVCAEMGDDEAPMRKRAFRDAMRKLENNPEAKIAGWPMLETSVGFEGREAIKSVFMPGTDASLLIRLSERYLYNRSTNEYIDLDYFHSGIGYTFDPGTLAIRHQNEFMDIAGKKKPIFKLLETSTLRRSVDHMDLYPDLTPASVCRMSRSGDVLSDDEDSVKGTITIFNTWRGWAIQPTKNLDLELEKHVVGMTDQLLTYLCQGNKAQMNWVWKFLAWTIQNPGKKQQVAPVFIGGQGVGKSFFGAVFLKAIFQDQWGQASAKILDNAFAVTPFIGKQMVFMDEAKFINETALDEAKKLIRQNEISGEEKFKGARNHKIFARIVFASNHYDINMSSSFDRTLFYIKTYDKDFMKMTEQNFDLFTQTLKPFFDKFIELLERTDVKEHLMHVLMNIKVTRHEIENVSISSANDPSIIEANMPHPRRIAKHIVESCYIVEDADITQPFTKDSMRKRIIDVAMELNIKRAVKFQDVMSLFNGMLEPYTVNGMNMWRFKHKAGTLTDMMEAVVGMKLSPEHVFQPEDYGENKAEYGKPNPRRGIVSRLRY